MLTHEDTGRFEEIMGEIKELLYEAKQITLSASNSMVSERARSYWLAHMKMAIDNDHDYLGGSMCSMEDTLNELVDEVDGEDEDY